MFYYGLCQIAHRCTFPDELSLKDERCRPDDLVRLGVLDHGHVVGAVGALHRGEALCLNLKKRLFNYVWESNTHVSVSRTHKVCLGDVADFRELGQQLDETCDRGGKLNKMQISRRFTNSF